MAFVTFLVTFISPHFPALLPFLSSSPGKIFSFMFIAFLSSLHPCHIISLFIAHFLILQNIFRFLVSVVSSGYMLTSTDLELKTSNKKRHFTLVFLGYHTPCIIFYFYQFTCKLYRVVEIMKILLIHENSQKFIVRK